MATGTYAPDPDLHVVDANGLPVSGGLVWTYIAGTTTPTPTYTDVGLLVPNSNPIVAGSDGRFVAFLAGGVSYKFVYETAAIPPAHGAVLTTRDNILAVTTLAAGAGGGVIQSTVLTGQVNDFPLLPGCAVLYCNNAPLTITGFAGGVAGQRLTVIGHSGPINFTQGDPASLLGNRLSNLVTLGQTQIAYPTAAFGSVTYIYSGQYWELVAHEQGAFIVPPFNAANFGASAGGTWTVTSGNAVMKYRLQGRQLTVFYQLSATVIGGTPTNLIIGYGAFGLYNILTGSFSPVAYASIVPADKIYTFTFSANQIGFALASGNPFTAATAYIHGTFVVEAN